VSRYLLERLASGAAVMLGVLLLVFALIHLVPGDPVEVMLGEHARPADREALRESLGLDKPLLEQLSDYLAGLAAGDLGDSLRSRRPISAMLAERIPNTAYLAVAAFAMAIVIGVPAGLFAATRPGTAADIGAMSVALAAVAIPNFVLGPLLVLVFSFALGWLPVSGAQSAASIVLPALTLGTSLAAVLSRMTRSTVLEVLGQDFVRTALAKGLSRSQVVRRHALGNALLPIVTVGGLQLGALLAGAVITEKVFEWPGIGLLLVDSIRNRDYPVVQGCVLLIAGTYVIVNTATDLVYAWLDPRIRLRG